MSQARLLVLLGILAAILPARGNRFRQPGRPLSCKNPYGLVIEGREAVLCLAASRTTARALVARAGHRCAAHATLELRLGDVLHVGPRCAMSRSVFSASQRLLLGLRIDVNHATAEDLRALPRIGKKLARRIVDSRRLHGCFGSPRALARVRGIGRKMVRRLLPLIRVEVCGVGAASADKSMPKSADAR